MPSRTLSLLVITRSNNSCTHYGVDLKLVRNAYYTEPADQSAWFYLKWLIQASKQLDANDSAWTDMVKNEITNLNELLSIEPDAPRTMHA